MRWQEVVELAEQVQRWSVQIAIAMVVANESTVKYRETREHAVNANGPLVQAKMEDEGDFGV